MKKTTLSIRIIYIISSIIYYITILSAFLFGLLIILNFSVISNLDLAIKMPFAVNFNEVGAVSVWGTEVSAKILDASGQIQLQDTPTNIKIFLALVLLIVWPMLFWLAYLLHRFMRNVSEGRVFDAQNFYYLRNLSYGLASIWLVTVVYMQLLKYMLLQEFKFTELSISSGSNWYVGVLGTALFIWVLSHVFLKGLELKEENELTI